MENNDFRKLYKVQNLFAFWHESLIITEKKGLTENERKNILLIPLQINGNWEKYSQTKFL